LSRTIETLGRFMQMAKHAKTTVTELTPEEVQKLLGDKVYARLRPEACARCSFSGEFDRRIFQIIGVPIAKQSDDTTQNQLSQYFCNKHGIESVCFRTDDRKFYADSAICPKCKSTAVTFDVVLDDEVMAALAARIGGDPKKMKADIEAIADVLRKREGDR
jgi:hypothetical protein